MIHYISGGARSGKSGYAQALALSLSQNPIYLATARNWDADFDQRIKRHQNDRDERWENIEEEKYPSKIDFTGRVVVLDCVTLWLTNFYVDTKYEIEEALMQIKIEIDKLSMQNATFIIISNELGMGLHADSESGRKFTDLQGWTNQYIAKKADKAIFMISGLPMVLK
ncbi:MAG: bifunctional adenosylcobinamide kinase/adenosylcobinamide-phosphate guanylyltransferase [Bacteroidetes bacterium]|nr:bifunctional adenosylcobinamide kinase/adenosylcobinamide-phosphate guanylyltransferase [Bacteroidota bacterium]MBU1373669.1 bifunctional adenosylcobinamide kinase/adenosylcobinamide-phosphate guanylyltransferase [Bacteroidota bacterium]MBU1484068.1 bifunctional adenosylcobinamide kinase/adenosylcobinamide-phosphate guanylyltransferase [Bacteroidota bacterium]MBU1759963.1 bifunctional adenosylcobinamide kinase/adenosylcobinamide-phosphate guanylyltransferase [Bacteroidota bacterium]MBU226844